MKLKIGAAVLLLCLCLHWICLPSYALPTTSARAYCLMDGSTFKVLAGKNEHERRGIASTTKIMTALTAIEKGNLQDRVLFTKESVGVEGSSLYLQEGDSATLGELLYGMMLSSANDAALAIALHIGGDMETFVGYMNERAESMNLSDTHFENPHGLDAKGHYSTAYDLAVMASIALENPVFRAIVSEKTHLFKTEKTSRSISNHNRLLSLVEGAVGVKTGFTKSTGRSLVGACERNGVRLVSVTLSDPDDWKDHSELLEYGFSLYEEKTVAGVGEVFCSLPTVSGSASRIKIENRDPLSLYLPRETVLNLRIEAPHLLYGDVSSGDEIGRAVVLYEGCVLATIPLYACGSSERMVYKRTLSDRIYDFFRT